MRNKSVWISFVCCALQGCSSDDKSAANDGGSADGGSSSGGSSNGRSANGGSSNGGSANNGTVGIFTGGFGGGEGGAGGSVGSGGEVTANTVGTTTTESAGGSNAGGTTGAGGTAGLAGMGGESGDGDCLIGEARNPATPESLDLFGTIRYYADGEVLPPGRYRVSLLDGCMKYSSNQDWTIHAYEAPDLGWYLGTLSGEKLVHLPGTVGFLASAGAYTDFEACVAANQALDPLVFDFDGGRLGIWLDDSNYADNLPGENGRNPLWELTRLGGCLPPIE